MPETTYFVGWAHWPPWWQWEVICHGTDEIAVWKYLERHPQDEQQESVVLLKGQFPSVCSEKAS